MLLQTLRLDEATRNEDRHARYIVILSSFRQASSLGAFSPRRDLSQNGGECRNVSSAPVASAGVGGAGRHGHAAARAVRNIAGGTGVAGGAGKREVAGAGEEAQTEATRAMAVAVLKGGGAVHANVTIRRKSGREAEDKETRSGM